MRTDLSLPPPFEASRDRDEEILWVGQPNFTAFVIRGIPFLIFGLLWGAFDYFGFIRNMGKEMAGLAIPFFALHLFPFWASILNMIWLFLVHGNTCYAFSNKRLMMSSFRGTDFKGIDHNKISDMEVNVNPVENLLSVGTIQAFSGRVSDIGGRIYDKFIGINDPYGVFKRIKEVSVDIKTEWNFPNAMRLEVNPGYQSKYERK